jgi:hypothetical protein
LNAALALGMLSFGAIGIASAQTVTAPQVQARLTEKGCTKVHELKFKEACGMSTRRPDRYPVKQVSTLS